MPLGHEQTGGNYGVDRAIAICLLPFISYLVTPVKMISLPGGLFSTSVPEPTSGHRFSTSMAEPTSSHRDPSEQSLQHLLSCRGQHIELVTRYWKRDALVHLLGLHKN